MYYLALVIPCYNEEQRIRDTISAYHEYFSKNLFFQNKSIALIPVNDGSKDKTGEVISQLEKLSTGNVSIIAVNYSDNRGKGGAIIEGCSKVDAEFYGFVDADLSFSPNLTEPAVKMLSEHGIIIGKRENKDSTSGYSNIRHWISKTIKGMVNFLFSLPKDLDIQCGFKFFQRDIAQILLPQIQQKRFSFDVELLVSAKSSGYRLASFPLEFTHNPNTSIIWKDGIRYFIDLLGIYERQKLINPYKFFCSLLAVIVFLVLGLYGWTIFKGYFFSDDFTWLWHGQKIGNSLTNILSFRMSTFYSPIMNALYAFSFSIFGYSAKPLFALNLIVHICSTLFFTILSWQLTKSKIIAATVALLIAIAGGAYEPLVWVGANMHSFVNLFILGSVISFWKFLISEKPYWLAISCIAFIFALGTKESAIVTPALLLLVLLYGKIARNINFRWKWLTPYGLVILLFSGFYGYQQYLWQKKSVWIQSGAWEVDWLAFFKLPIVIFDNFLPIGFLKDYLNFGTAILLWIIAVAFIAFLIFKFRKTPALWFGLAWIVITISPVIFFKTEFWWEPLASRYLYLSRFGAVLIVSAILQHLIVYNKARFIISKYIYLIILITAAQTYFMYSTISSQYRYVYNTGRQLTAVFEKIREENPEKIYVQWDHPFTANNAHIVGAASVIGGIKEERIEFLQKAPIRQNLIGNELLLYWDATSQKYAIIKAISR